MVAFETSTSARESSILGGSTHVHRDSPRFIDKPLRQFDATVNWYRGQWETVLWIGTAGINWPNYSVGTKNERVTLVPISKVPRCNLK